MCKQCSDSCMNTLVCTIRHMQTRAHTWHRQLDTCFRYCLIPLGGLKNTLWEKLLMFYRHEFWKIQQTDSKAKMWKLVGAGWIIPKPSGLFLVCVHWLWNSVHLIYGVHLSPLLLPTDSCPWFWEDNSSFDLELSAEALTSAPEVLAHEKSGAASWHECPPSKEGTWDQLGFKEVA